MNIFHNSCAALVALLMALSSVGQSAQAAQPASIVLVHGVLLDGSSRRGVYDVLTRHGFRVTVAQQPLTGFGDDVAATKRANDQQVGPVDLVGHSYGGAVIKVAGTDPKAKALIYVAGLQPEVGATAGEVAPPVDGSHAVLISQARVVARVIEAAARSVQWSVRGSSGRPDGTISCARARS